MDCDGEKMYKLVDYSSGSSTSTESITFNPEMETVTEFESEQPDTVNKSFEAQVSEVEPTPFLNTRYADVSEVIISVPMMVNRDTNVMVDMTLKDFNRLPFVASACTDDRNVPNVTEAVVGNGSYFDKENVRPHDAHDEHVMVVDKDVSSENCGTGNVQCADFDNDDSGKGTGNELPTSTSTPSGSRNSNRVSREFRVPTQVGITDDGSILRDFPFDNPRYSPQEKKHMSLSTRRSLGYTKNRLKLKKTHTSNALQLSALEQYQKKSTPPKSTFVYVKNVDSTTSCDDNSLDTSLVINCDSDSSYIDVVNESSQNLHNDDQEQYYSEEESHAADDSAMTVTTEEESTVPDDGTDNESDVADETQESCRTEQKSIVGDYCSDNESDEIEQGSNIADDGADNYSQYSRESYVTCSSQYASSQYTSQDDNHGYDDNDVVQSEDDDVFEGSESDTSTSDSSSSLSMHGDDNRTDTQNSTPTIDHNYHIQKPDIVDTVQKDSPPECDINQYQVNTSDVGNDVPADENNGETHEKKALIDSADKHENCPREAAEDAIKTAEENENKHSDQSDMESDESDTTISSHVRDSRNGDIAVDEDAAIGNCGVSKAAGSTTESIESDFADSMNGEIAGSENGGVTKPEESTTESDVADSMPINTLSSDDFTSNLTSTTLNSELPSLPPVKTSSDMSVDLQVTSTTIEVYSSNESVVKCIDDESSVNKEDGNELVRSSIDSSQQSAMESNTLPEEVSEVEFQDIPTEPEKEDESSKVSSLVHHRKEDENNEENDKLEEQKEVKEWASSVECNKEETSNGKSTDDLQLDEERIKESSNVVVEVSDTISDDMTAIEDASKSRDIIADTSTINEPSTSSGAKSEVEVHEQSNKSSTHSGDVQVVVVDNAEAQGAETNKDNTFAFPESGGLFWNVRRDSGDDDDEANYAIDEVVGVIVDRPSRGYSLVELRDLMAHLGRYWNSSKQSKMSIFEALLKQIEVPPTFKETHLKSMVIKYIGAYTNDVKRLIKTNLEGRHMTLMDYVNKLGAKEFDGAEMTLLIISQMFSVPIAIYHPEYIWMSHADKQIHECPIVLLHDCNRIWHATIPNGGVRLKLNDKIDFSEFAPKEPKKKFSFPKKRTASEAFKEETNSISDDVVTELGDTASDKEETNMKSVEDQVTIKTEGDSITADETDGEVIGTAHVVKTKAELKQRLMAKKSRSGQSKKKDNTKVSPRRSGRHANQATPKASHKDTVHQKSGVKGNSSVKDAVKVKSPLKVKAEIKEKSAAKGKAGAKNQSTVKGKGNVKDNSSSQAKVKRKDDTKKGDKPFKEYELRNRGSASKQPKIDSGKSDSKKRKRTDCPDWVDPQIFPTKRVTHDPIVKQEPVDPDDDDVIFCTKCNETFINTTDLKNHEKKCFTGRRYGCFFPGCDKSFSQRSIMHQHYKGVHQRNPYHCPECNAPYIFSKVMNYHMKKDHKKDEVHFKYNCEKCQFGTDNKSEYQIHTDRHNNFKRYVCGNCNYRTFSSSQLNLHMNSCIEGIKYDCTECGKEFEQKAYLKNHVKHEHVEGKNVHFCDKCIKIYKYKKHYVKHMKTEHNYVVT